LLTAEALSRYGGGPPSWTISYDLPLHILQGDPAEGYTLLFSYLWRVETGLGVVLVALLGLALGQRVRHVGLVTLITHTSLQKNITCGATAIFRARHCRRGGAPHRLVRPAAAVPALYCDGGCSCTKCRAAVPGGYPGGAGQLRRSSSLLWFVLTFPRAHCIPSRRSCGVWA